MDVKRIKSRGKMANGEPNPIDVYVGKRMRLRRQMLCLSQEKLAAALGLTFQQVQKYERGLNRMGASRLWDIAAVLNVPINYFFDGMDSQIRRQSPSQLYGAGVPFSVNKSDPLFSMENIELVDALSKIKNPSALLALRDLISALAS